MGPLKRIIDRLKDEILDPILISKEHVYIRGRDLVTVDKAFAEKEGLKIALRIVQQEYDKYHKPKCKQEQLALPLKEDK